MGVSLRICAQGLSLLMALLLVIVTLIIQCDILFSKNFFVYFPHEFYFAHSLAVYLSDLGWLLHQWLHPAVL